MITDGHNHTKHFSVDAGQTIDELIAEAKSKGFTRIGITEHYELDYPDYDGLNWMFDIKEYDRVFEEWRKKAGELELLKGIEFGYQTHVAEEIDKTAELIDFDVVLMSIHLFRGEDFYVVRDCYKMPAKELHSEYISMLAESCERCNNYDVAAHYDYINRYTDKKSDFVTYDECPKRRNSTDSSKHLFQRKRHSRSTPNRSPSTRTADLPVTCLMRQCLSATERWAEN